MANLTQEQLNHLEQLLTEREQALRTDLNRESDVKDSFVEVATEIPDPGDASFANLSIDLGNAAITRDVAELRAIDGARARMANGTYGNCVNCEAEIPYERLEAQPTAERCAPCQEAYEKTHTDGHRGASI
ncbi:TraR/DksA family transcriptional regulator [Noviherbaspirillum massiliense]|uniref:TraR/DksA family transcriptional regulator n=1 Tax=Noviherbaspirillum massiliense TaxID=1465823 RepID=UPI0002E35767|nr:TraR/DksA family transcriptional regulator [Noviherbaspirillum massiliense]